MSHIQRHATKNSEDRFHATLLSRDCAKNLHKEMLQSDCSKERHGTIAQTNGMKHGETAQRC